MALILKPKPERIARGLWWDRSWNLVGGCTPVDESCGNCWGAREAARFAHNPNEAVRARHAGLVDDGGRWTGEVRFRRDLLDLPLHTRKPAVWALWMDLFHPAVATPQIAEAFATMTLAQQHLFLILTKRPRRMAELLADGAEALLDQVGLSEFSWPLPNVWLGTSASNQDMADERIPELLRCPAALHFVSCEPLLGPIDLNRLDKPISGPGSPLPAAPPMRHSTSALTGWTGTLDWHNNGAGHVGPKLGLVIAGGESGPGARPTHPDWVRSLRDQCVEARVPFTFKQWGEWLSRSQGGRPTRAMHWGTLGYDGSWFPEATTWNGRQEDSVDRESSMARVGKKRAGRLVDGREWLQWPADQEKRQGQ